MIILQRFLASLLLPTLVSATILVAIHQTILNGTFIKSELVQVGIYPDLATYLPNQLMSDSSTSSPEDVAAKAKIMSVITPELLQKKAENTLDQAEAVAAGDSATITFSLNDVVAKLRAGGVPVQGDSFPDTTFSLHQQPKAESLLASFRLSEHITWIALAILSMLVVALAFAKRNFGPLTGISLWFFLYSITLYVATRFIPTQADKLIKRDSANMVHFWPFIQQLITDFATRLGVVFGICAVIAVILAIISFTLSHFLKPMPTSIQSIET